MTIGSGRRRGHGGGGGGHQPPQQLLVPRGEGGLQPAQSGAGGGWRLEAGVRRSLPGAGVERGDQQQQQDEAAQHGDQAEAGQRGGEAGAGGHQLQLAPVQIQLGQLRLIPPGLGLQV